MLIVDRVGQLVAQYGTRNPFEICDWLDIIVLTAPLDGLRGIYLCEDGVETITISTNLSQLTAKYVCGHELGHSQMHKGINRIFMDSKTFMLPSRFENEADKFAAHLLYGAPPLYQEPVSYQEMAEILNVSVCNVDTRLIELGIHW